MADLRIDLAADFRGRKAFKEADKATSRLDKSVSKLGKQIGGLFAAQKLYSFGKASVKAFAADEAAAARLATAVDNLGLSLFRVDVEKFIQDTQTSAGILDDQLRPAMQGLLTTTGSLAKSQMLLNDAIQISRASGIDLATVAQDLANGYVGITRGLKKYNTGLTQAELKSKSFNEILGVMLAKSANSAQAYLTTTSYKLDTLNVAAQNAKETIGAGLVDAFAKIGGGSDAKDAAQAIDNIAKVISKVVIGVGTAIGLVEKFRKGYTNLLAGGDVSTMLKPSVASTNRSASPAGTAARMAQARSAETAAAKRAKELATIQLKATKALTAEQKKQAALKKAGTVFDLEQIQLIAALKGNISKEERTRLEAQLAILNENDVLASSLTKQILMAQDATGGLYKYFLTIGDAKIKNPFAFLDDWLTEFQKKMNATLQQSNTYKPAALAPELAAIGVVAGYGDYAGSVTNQASNLQFPSYGMQTGSGDTIVNVTVQGNVIKEQELINQVLAGTQLSSLSGSPSQIGRIAGMFG